MAYVEEALAELPISGDGSRQLVKAKKAVDDWEEALPALKDRMEELERRLAKVRARLKKQEAKWSQAVQETTKKVEAPPPKRRWLKSTRPNGKIHREASRPSDDTLPSESQTGCTWKFGLSTFYEWVTEAEVREAPDSVKCDRGCDVWF